MKTWLITGASSGIGRRVTEHLLERGDRVAATARRPEQLAELADKYGDQLWTAELAVTDAAQTTEVVDRVAEAVIAVAETTPAPLRLTLGSDAYQHIQEALRRRLDELTAQRDLAYSTDDVS